MAFLPCAAPWAARYSCEPAWPIGAHAVAPPPQMLPIFIPYEFSDAMNPANSGAEILVPPLPCHAPLKYRFCGLLSQSPFSEMSGTALAAEVQNPPLMALCHEGAANFAEQPPPVLPPLPAQPDALAGHAVSET